MPPVGFEPTISAGEWLQTYTLDRLATGTSSSSSSNNNNNNNDDDDDDDDDDNNKVTRSVRKNLEAIPGKHSIDSLQKTAILTTHNTHNR